MAFTGIPCAMVPRLYQQQPTTNPVDLFDWMIGCHNDSTPDKEPEPVVPSTFSVSALLRNDDDSDTDDAERLQPSIDSSQLSVSPPTTGKKRSREASPPPTPMPAVPDDSMVGHDRVAHARAFEEAQRLLLSAAPSDDTRITVWNRIAMRKTAGKAAPMSRNLESFLLKNPQYEVYTMQDAHIHPEKKKAMIAAQRRIDIWNKNTRKRVSGNAAPREAKLAEYLKKHPECEVYSGQDKGSRWWENSAAQSERDEDDGQGATAQHRSGSSSRVVRHSKMVQGSLTGNQTAKLVAKYQETAVKKESPNPPKRLAVSPPQQPTCELYEPINPSYVSVNDLASSHAQWQVNSRDLCDWNAGLCDVPGCNEPLYDKEASRRCLYHMDPTSLVAAAERRHTSWAHEPGHSHNGIKILMPTGNH